MKTSGQNCNTCGVGALEKRTVTLYLGARLQKDKIAEVQSGSLVPACRVAGLSSSPHGGLGEFFEFFVLASELLSERDHFFCKKYSMFSLCQIGKKSKNLDSKINLKST